MTFAFEFSLYRFERLADDSLNYTLSRCDYTRYRAVRGPVNGCRNYRPPLAFDNDAILCPIKSAADATDKDVIGCLFLGDKSYMKLTSRQT